MSRGTRYVLQRTDLLYALVFVYYPGIFWYPLGAFKLTIRFRVVHLTSRNQYTTQELLLFLLIPLRNCSFYHHLPFYRNNLCFDRMNSPSKTPLIELTRYLLIGF